MGLKEYKRKRDFSRTPEPKGDANRAAKGNSYLIQKHAARRLHYDLRLELDGVLISWAVPKGPSLDPKERRLAVHVEDHPLEYGSFEGTIPKGEYGGGTVLLWDRGTWEPEGDPHEGLRRGDFKFKLYGEKLRGSWVLVRMGEAAEDGKENWLLIKHSDEESAPLNKRDILEERPESVVTGRSMEEIADPGAGAVDPGSLPSVAKASMPEKIEPQLATLAAKVPGGGNWLHEIKFDGYRALCRIERGKAYFYTREGHDWTDRFGKLPETAGSLPVKSAILDGEIVVLRPDGTSSFQALQNTLGGQSKDSLTYYVFDLLHMDGFDLRKVPLIRRKELLATLLKNRSGPIRLSDHYQGSGEELLEGACKHALEGIISKRADCPYISGRTKDWLKVKCLHGQEFVIGGFTDPAGSRKGFGALLVGTFENGSLIFCGRVGTGYTDQTLKELRSHLQKLQQPDLMTFDLDPDSAVRWQQVTDAAHEIRSLLQELGLESFVKTTGGKGLHVVVPLTAAAGWDQVKEFSKEVSETLVSLFPDRYIANMSKTKRKGKIFVDYLRNGRGATAICPYSTRARSGAPVSVPVHWDELRSDLRPDQFTIRNLHQRMAHLKQDPWKGIEKTRQSITATMRKKLISRR